MVFVHIKCLFPSLLSYIFFLSSFCFPFVPSVLALFCIAVRYFFCVLLVLTCFCLFVFRLNYIKFVYG